MKVRIRGSDRMYCMECSRVIREGEEAVFINDMTCCLGCAVDYLIARIESVERRIEELELRNGIAVPV